MTVKTPASGSFDRYTYWSLYFLIAVAPLIAALTVGYMWADRTVWTWLFIVAMVGVVTTSVLLLRPAIGKLVSGAPLPRTLTGVHLAVGAVGAVAAAMDTRPTTETGFSPESTLLMASFALILIPFAAYISYTTLWTLSLAAGVVLAANWARLVVQVDPEKLDAVHLVGVVVPLTLILGGYLTTVRMSSWFLQLWDQEREFGRTRADLAVAEERLRFSRDLHDIFGRTLTGVALKADLAAALADAGRSEDAASQMREVHTLANEALKEVRAVVQGYRRVDLATELDGARAMLESAGVRTRVVGDPASVPPAVAEALGWVVREAVTNVVRHADATTCRIELTEEAGDVVLTVTNDGVPRRSDADPGSGLAGLAARLAPLGGTVDGERAGTHFTLTARVAAGASVPLPTPDPEEVP